jgi:Ca2+-binding RTX toxin-like protein
MRPPVLGLLLALLVLALGAGPAAAYDLTLPAGNSVAITGAPDASLGLTIARDGTNLKLTPGAASIPAPCSGDATQTSCPIAALAGLVGGVSVTADQLTLWLTDLQAPTLTVNGGDETDIIEGTGLAIGAIHLDTGDGDDEVALAGAFTSIDDAEDAGDDRYMLDSPTLTGTFSLGDGDDTVLAPASSIALNGGPGRDVLESRGTLSGDEGDDILRPQTPTQAVFGGDGTDRVSFAAVPDGLTLQRVGADQTSVSGAPPTISRPSAGAAISSA